MKIVDRIFKSKWLLIIITLLIPLSYIKFYTAKITFPDDPTVAIVKTNEIQLLNNVHKVNYENSLYAYEENGIKLLYADEMGHMWEGVHSLIIVLWWVIFFPILILMILYIFNKYMKYNKSYLK